MRGWVLAALVLLVTAGWAGADTWTSDSDIVSGLGDIGAYSKPTVFLNDGVWYLISGNSGGSFNGFDWTGSTWQTNTTIAGDLGDIGYNSAPTVFQKDGTWYLISGDYYGVFNGYIWTGSAWQSDSGIVSGLVDVGFNSAPTVFQKDSTWYLISGEEDGVFNGYIWTGSAWQSDSGIVSGLGDVGGGSSSTVFQKDSTWYFIAGKNSGYFNGYIWTGSAWQSDNGIVSGLVYIAGVTAPVVFQKNTIWYLISGNYYGVFDGYNIAIPLTILPNTIGKFWVNHTWDEGTEVCADSYNISINEIWHNGTTNTYYNNTLTTYGDWSNITVYSYNNTDGLSGYAIFEDIQLPYPIPATPAGAGSTWDYYWVNHTWTEGSSYGIWCGDTDSYNVSINETWYNGTTNLHYNNTGLSPHVWSNASIYAFNDTAGINETYIYQNVQMVNRAITITNTSDWSGWEDVNVYVDYDATDPDSDSPTFSCNRTDLFTDFDTATGEGNWTATTGTYYMDFGVSDGYGSTDNYTMTITGYPLTPTPTNLQNTTGLYWVNHTWQAGSGLDTDSYNVSINDIWHNGTTTTYYNDTPLTEWGEWSNITVYAYSAVTDNCSLGAVSADVRAKIPSLEGYNNITNTSSTIIIIYTDHAILFGCSADAVIPTWVWSGVDSSSGTTDTLITNATRHFSTAGTYGVTVIGNNSEATTEQVTWTVIVTNPQQWWDYQWDMRVPITIDNTCGSELNNFFIPVTLNTSGCYWSDCSDLRVVNSDNTATLTWYCQSDTASGTPNHDTSEIIYVHIDSLPVGITSIYAYYGNIGSVTKQCEGAGFLEYVTDFDTEPLPLWIAKDIDELYYSYERCDSYVSMVEYPPNDFGVYCDDYDSQLGVWIGTLGYSPKWHESNHVWFCSPYKSYKWLLQPTSTSVNVKFNTTVLSYSGWSHSGVFEVGGYLAGGTGGTTIPLNVSAGDVGVWSSYEEDVVADVSLGSATYTSIDTTFVHLSYTLMLDDLSMTQTTPCTPSTDVGDVQYKPNMIILLRDSSSNFINNAQVAIRNIVTDEWMTDKWVVDEDGVLYFEEVTTIDVQVAVRTFDGVFMNDVHLEPDSITNITIPIHYNLKVYPVDEQQKPLTDVFAGLAEYTPISPQAFWGYSMSGSQYVPVTNCSGFSMCDIIAEKGGYEDYKVEALNWTSKSALVKDYRHNIVMEEE